jgi:hypothetical protein
MANRASRKALKRFNQKETLCTMRLALYRIAALAESIENYAQRRYEPDTFL